MIPFVRKYAAALAVLALSACQARAAGPQDPAAGSLTGRIASDDGTPLVGVVVSDGVRVTQTDAEGMYALNSDKELGYVFVSIPSGYMAAVDATAIPQFFAYTAKPAEESERHDFTLTPVENTRHTLIAATDHHLADRESLDVGQFTAEGGFIDDVKATAAAASSPVYSICMGDMSWDEYWHKHGFMLPDFRRLYARHTFPCPVFNAMGNHDNDPWCASDQEASAAFRREIGPTYYSFNIGKAHFVCLDDIAYINNGGAVGTIGDKSYKNYVTEDQLAWLRKDLALVEDRTAPLFVLVHAPLAYPNASFGNTYYDEARAGQLLDCFDGFSEVHVLSGHSHDNRNCQLTDAVIDHNTGAVCACWWWSGVYADRHICKDGTPGGYGVYELEGKDLTWYYKGTGLDRDIQFRTYDMNKVWLDPATYLDDRTITVDGTPVAIRDWFSQQAYGKSFDRQRSDNCVYINCWNWDPAWKIEVAEEGRGALAVTRLWEYDPLHLITYTIPRLNKGSRPSFTANKMGHLFSVQASSPVSTLRITVTDRFGRVYTEEMKRPKSFNIYAE